MPWAPLHLGGASRGSADRPPKLAQPNTRAAHMTVPTSAASIHAVLSRHLADLEAAGPKPGRYVYRFDNGMCLRMTDKITVVGLLQATTFEGEETERPGYDHIRNLCG